MSSGPFSCGGAGLSLVICYLSACAAFLPIDQSLRTEAEWASTGSCSQHPGSKLAIEIFCIYLYCDCYEHDYLNTLASSDATWYVRTWNLIWRAKDLLATCPVGQRLVGDILEDLMGS